jgi:hypothetical protein
MKKHGETKKHCPRTANCVDFSGFSQRHHNDATVIIVILDVLLENFGRRLDGQHVVNNQFAESSQVIAAFVHLPHWPTLRTNQSLRDKECREHHHERSVVENLVYLDTLKDVPIDPMHLFDLGTMRRLLSFLFGTKKDRKIREVLFLTILKFL